MGHRLTDRLRQHACANVAGVSFPLCQLRSLFLSLSRSPDVASRRRCRSVDSFRNTFSSLVLAGLAYTCGQNSAVLTLFLSLSLSIYARARTCTIWPRLAASTRVAAATKHGGLSIPSSPPSSRRRAARRHDHFLIRESLARFFVSASPKLALDFQPPVTTEWRRIVAYLSRDCRSPAWNLLRFKRRNRARAARSNRSSESAPNAADGRSISRLFLSSPPLSLARSRSTRAKAAIDVNKWNIPVEAHASRESKGLFGGTIFFTTIRTVLRCRLAGN